MGYKVNVKVNRVRVRIIGGIRLWLWERVITVRVNVRAGFSVRTRVEFRVSVRFRSRA